MQNLPILRRKNESEGSNLESIFFPNLARCKNFESKSDTL